MEEEEKSVEKKSCKKIMTIIISIVVGLILGAIIMYILSITNIFCPSKKLAKVNGQSYTLDDIYNSMNTYIGGENNAAIQFLLESVDYNILSKKYPIDETMQKEIDKYVPSYIYSYGLNEEYAKTYVTVLQLRYAYYLDYLSQFISDDEVQSYYDNNIVGDIDCEYLLINSSNGVLDSNENFTDDQALALANEIISKLNSGVTLENVISEYTNSEKYSNYITNESLICQTIASTSNSSDKNYALYDEFEDEFVKSLLSLKDNTYSTTPVKTSSGYYIIYRKNQSEKDSFENLKSAIIKKLAEEYSSTVEETDPYLFFKNLIELREEKGFKIYDKDLASAYEDYCKNFSEDDNSLDESDSNIEENNFNNSNDVDISTNVTE